MSKHAPSADAAPSKRRIGWFGRTLIAVGVVALLLALSVALLGPTIAASFAPGFIERAAAGRTPGVLRVGSVDLSWTGPQRLRAVEYRDESGGVVAKGDVEATTSLLAAAFGSRDLGTITVSGRADLTAPQRKPAGVPQPAPGAPPAPSGGALRLPAALRAKLVLDGVTVSYADPARTSGGGPVGVSNLTGSVEIATGQPVKIAIRGDAIGGGGSVELKATIDNLLGADGAVTPDSAAIDATAHAGVPAGLVDALLGQPGLADDALRGAAVVDIDAKGDRTGGSATLRITGGEGSLVRADASLVMADGALSLAGPATLSAPITQALVDRLSAGAASKVTLDAPVIATLTVPMLHAPAAPGADLRGVAFAIELATTVAKGAIHDASGGAQPFALSPLAARLDAPDLAGPVALRASTSATFGGRSAGDFVVDITATNLLDDHGALRSRAGPSLRGKVQVAGLATALAQPFVERYGLDLPNDVGVAIDGAVVAATQGGGDAPGAIPPTDVTMTLHAQRLSIRGELTLSADAVRTREGGVVARVEGPAPTLSRLLAGAGVRVGGDGALSLTVTELALPLSAGALNVGAARAHAEVEAGRFTIWPHANAPAIDASSTRLTLDLKPGAAPAATFDADLASGGKPFTASARLTADGLIDTDGALTPSGAHPTGSVAITGLPGSIADVFLADAGARELARQVLGDALDATLTARAGDGGRTIVEMDAKAASASAHATVTAAPGDSARVTNAALNATLTPALADAAAQWFAPDTRPAPSLRAPVRAVLTVAEFAIPLSPGWAPDMARLGAIEARLSLADDAVLTGLRLAGAPANLGLGAAAGRLRLDPSAGGALDGALTARLFDPASPTTTIASLAVDAARSGAGALAATARLTDVRTADADRLLSRPDLLQLSLGDTAAATIAAQRRSSADPTLIDVSLKAPKLTTDLHAQLMSDRIELARPASVSWTMDERWAARYLLPQRPDGTAALRVVGPTEVTLSLRKIAIALGEGPLKPGVFTIDARVDAPSLALLAGAGEPRRYRDVAVVVDPGDATGSLALQAVMKGEDAAAGSFQATAEVVGYADASGKPTPGEARLTGDAHGTLPAELVDVLASGHGRIAEALGDSVKIDAKADGFSRAGGTLHIDADAPRATATLDGAVHEGAFVADKPARAELTTITPELGQLVFSRLFPLIGQIEKRPDDGPAVINATGLVAPVDGDMRKLEGVVTIDLGKLHYRAATFFGNLLRATRNNPDSALFGNWPQLVVTIRQGVATYDRVTLPIGDFALATRGTVDLVQRKVDVITYVPLVALVDEVANIAGKVPGVTRDTLIPLRTRGSFGSLKTEPALDLLLKENVQQPGGLIDDLLKQIQKGGDKKKKTKQPASDSGKPR